MPYAGEEPITSFFPRISSREKRKEGSDIHIRKRTQPDTEANKPLASSKKPKVQQTLLLRDASKSRGNIVKVMASPLASAECAAIGRTESLSSIPRDSSATPPPVEAVSRDTSATPGHIQRDKLLPTLITTFRRVPAYAIQTPPTDVSAEKVPRFPTGLHPTDFPSSTPKLRVTPDSLPTSITIAHHTVRAQVMAEGRELSRTLSSTDASSIESNTLSRLPPPGFPSEEGLSWDGCHFSSPTFSQLVPSSQSQNDGFEPDKSFPLYAGNHSKSSIPPKSPLFLEPRLPDQLFRDVSTNPPSVETSGIEDSDDYQCIHSSQSQHMLPFHASPRKIGGKTGYLPLSSPLSDDATLSSTEEIIPSSQSQTEIELDMSKKMPDYGPLIRPIDGITTDESRSSHFDWHTSVPDAMQLTPVAGSSIRENANNFFADASHADQLLADGDPSSATEDESESENDALFPDRTASRLSSGTEELGVLAHFPLTHSQESTDYPSSLPEAVKEFQDMFGEGDGSYPDDFPMSLR